MLKINDWRLLLLLMLSVGNIKIMASEGEKKAYSSDGVEALLTEGTDKGLSAFGGEASDSDTSSKASKTKPRKSKSPKGKFKGKGAAFCDVGKMGDVDEEVADSISDKLEKVVLEQADRDNEHWQKQIAKVKSHYRGVYEKKLRDNALGACSANSVGERYARVWLSGMNKVIEIELEAKENESDDLGFSDDEGGTEEVKNVKRTTLLNVALRYGKDEGVDKKDYLKKILTLIDNGANKNKNPKFTSGNMINQPEIPLQIVFREIKDLELMNDLLTEVFFKDDRSFKIEMEKEDGDGVEKVYFEDPRTAPVIDSMVENHDYLLNKFYEEKNFIAFDCILRYLESHDLFITEDYQDKTGGVPDGVRLPMLYTVLKDMKTVREKSFSLDSEGNRKDNIAEFFKWSVVKNSLNDNYDTRFGERLQSQLRHDYNREFKKMADIIDSTRSTTDLKGKDLKENVVAWTVMANFRNRLAYHLNRYALTQTIEGSKSNVVKLVRYAQISSNEKHLLGSTNEDAIYAELAVLNGLDAIFLRRNIMRWTPLMFAMSQRLSDGLDLLLHQAVHPITTIDGVGNNLLHLAFPVPEKALTSMENKEDDNPLAQVGASIGEPDFVQRTEDCIRTVINDTATIEGTDGEFVISYEDKAKALTQKSALNYTPLSLAAMTGFHELYDEMKNFLDLKGDFYEEDHSRIGYHIEELVIKGMEAYRKQKIELAKENPEKEWTDAENRDLLGKIKLRKERLKNKYEKAIRKPYSRKSEEAKARYKEIEAAGDAYLAAFDKMNVREQTGNPYEEALKRAMDAMIHPKGREFQREYSETGEVVVEAVMPEKKSFFSFAKKKKATPEPVQKERPKTETVIEESKLVGINDSTSPIKASYLRPYVQKIVRRFLKENESPQKMPLDIAYKRITGRKSQNFFREVFNSKVIEREMLETIEKTMKAEERLYEEEKEKEKDESAFSSIERQSREVSSDGEGSSDEESDDGSSWYDEDEEDDDSEYETDSDEYETDSDEDE